MNGVSLWMAFAGLSVANLAWAGVVDGDWLDAIRNSYYQGGALLTVWGASRIQQLAKPKCIGYPDCDGDLVATPHSEKCPLGRRRAT